MNTIIVVQFVSMYVPIGLKCSNLQQQQQQPGVGELSSASLSSLPCLSSLRGLSASFVVSQQADSQVRVTLDAGEMHNDVHE